MRVLPRAKNGIATTGVMNGTPQYTKMDTPERLLNTVENTPQKPANIHNTLVRSYALLLGI